MERDSTTVKCTLTEVLDRLDELQDDAMEQADAERGPNDEPTPQTMYYIGKDSGIAEAKQRIRLIGGEQDTSDSK
jgi:hypothetical protein